MGGLELNGRTLPCECDDSIIGSVRRDQAHIRGILHRAGMIFVTRPDGKILLTRRSPSKDTFPHTYDSSCAFHVTFGESYEEAARRELAEETGIHGITEYVGKFSFNEPPENEMVAVFLCISAERVKIDPEESVDANWYSATEIDRIVTSKRVTPWLRDVWRLARDKITPASLTRALNTG